MGIIQRIGHFYFDGFRSMTLGKTLWAIILVKLFILFFVLRWFFFPDYLDQASKGGETSDYVSSELVNRAINP